VSKPAIIRITPSGLYKPPAYVEPLTYSVRVFYNDHRANSAGYCVGVGRTVREAVADHRKHLRFFHLLGAM
jgi:hypothetical protein